MSFQDQKATFGRRGTSAPPAMAAAAPAGGFATFNGGGARRVESDEEFRKRTQALVGDVSALLRSSGDSGQDAGRSGAVTQQMLLTYVASNQHYYAGVIQRMADNGDEFRSLTPGWIWGGFFFSFYWLLYRKLWLYAGLHLVLNTVFFMLFLRQPLLGLGLIVALNTVVAVFGKSLYVAKGARRLRASLAIQGSLDQMTVARLGGVSVLAVVLSIVGIGLLGMLMGGMVAAYMTAHPELLMQMHLHQTSQF